MKNFVLLVGLIIGLTASAQQYFPLPDTNIIWKEWYASLSQSSYSMYLDHYYDGDTTIGSHNYSKIYSDRYVSAQSIVYHWYDGAIRNDSAARMVYIVPRDSSADFVLYDFNLAVGQFFPVAWYCMLNPHTDTVAVIDSVLVGNYWHKRYRNSDGYHELIEGIGSTGGLLAPHMTSGSEFTELLCVYHNDRPVWPDTSSGCASFIGIHDNDSDSNLELFPTPSAGKLQFRNVSGTTNKVTVYSADGRLLQEYSVQADAFELDLSGEPEGVYFICLINQEEGTVLSRRVLIAR